MPSIGDVTRTLTIRGVADGVDATTAAAKSLGAAFDDAATAAKGSAEQISSAFSSVQQAAGGSSSGLSLFSTIGLGAAAGTAALAVFFDWLSKTNKELGDLQQTAREAGLSLGDFQKLQFAASSQGVSGSSIASGTAQMAANLDEATRNANDLSKLLDANNVKFKDGNKLLIDDNQLWDIARDLISRAANAQQQIKIADMLGLTKEWIPLLSQSADAFNASKNSAQALGLIIDDATIQKAKEFDDAWRLSGTAFSTWIKAKIAEIIPSIDDLVAKAQQFGSSVSQGISNIASGPGGQLAANAERAAAVLAAGQADDSFVQKQYTAILAAKAFTGAIDEATKAILDQAVAVNKAEAAITAIADGYDRSAAAASKLPKIPAAQPTTIIPGNDDNSKTYWDRATDSIAKHTSQLNADTLAVGQSVGVDAQLRAEFQLLQAARQDDAGVTDDQIAAYTTLRASMDSQQALTAAGIKLNADHADSFNKLTASINAAATANATAKIDSNIAFGRQTALLSPEDAQIANQLKTIFGNDVPAALQSSQAAALRFNQALVDSRTLAENFADNFGQAMLQGKTATQALSSALTSLESSLISMISRRLVDNALGALIPSLGGIFGGTGGALPGALPLGAGGIGHAHTGGIIGIDALAKTYVHPAYFENAPRFHSGGMIGSDEVPIVARRGEGVFTPAQMAAMGGASVEVNVNIDNQTSSDVSVQKQKNSSGGVDLMVMVRSAVDQNLASGAHDKSMRGRYGVTPVGQTR